MKLTEEQRAEVRKKLEERVRDMAEDAASWYDVDEGNAARTLEGIEDCDPAVLDTFPAVDWSGQWADGPSWEAELEDAIMGALDGDEESTTDVLLNDDFEDLFAEVGQDHASSVVEHQIAKRARYYLTH